MHVRHEFEIAAATRWGRPGRSRRRGIGHKGCQGSVGMLASMTHEHAGLMCNGRGSEQEQGWPGCGGLLAKQTHLSFPSPPRELTFHEDVTLEPAQDQHSLSKQAG